MASAVIDAIDADPQKRTSILDEKHRVGWTQASGPWNRSVHRMQTALGLRNSKDKVKAFIELMANGKNHPGATTLDLGDGWTRITHLVGAKTASLDIRTDACGAIVDARGPSQFPQLPRGKERAAFSTVLDELQSGAGPALRKVPVYYVNRNTRGYGVPTHGYVVTGDPGKGRNSGATLYGVGGDPKRGALTLDSVVMARLNAKVSRGEGHKLPQHVRDAIATLAGSSFSSREELYDAYRRARGENPDPSDIAKEMASVYRLLPAHTMELWPKATGDYRTTTPSTAERDVRAFETPPKELRKRIAIKKVEGVNNVDLIEAKQQFLLHRRYQDELMGRDGSGVPSDDLVPTLDPAGRQALAASTPRFQRLPPHTTGKAGNCNSGAASLLQRAMDKQGKGASGRAASASLFGLGGGHRIELWDPLNPREGARPKLPSLPPPVSGEDTANDWARDVEGALPLNKPDEDEDGNKS